ncbi:MAG: vitamin B12 dependent-methionine synthase activation domain-containing protein, partial [Deefgea sp.]
ARSHKFAPDWSAYTPPTPSFLGVREYTNYSLAEIEPFIDWTPFFQSWELHGRYPAILQDEVVGEAARSLYADAKAMLKKIIAEKWIAAAGVIGFFPAASVNHDDIELYDPTTGEVAMTWHNLRQQLPKPKTGDVKPNWCLADFIAPKETGVKDYIGAFAVTGGIGIDEPVKAFEEANDDYSAILLKSLADRFAEAFAEHMHYRVRTELWGYAKDEALSNDELVDEKYVGVRPAPGYPACPDHTPKVDMFKVLNAPNIGMTLTEGYAMLPTAAVSGFYFSHPESRYFGVGKVTLDQVEDYAARRGVSLAQAERDLAPNLGYVA